MADAARCRNPVSAGSLRLSGWSLDCPGRGRRLFLALGDGSPQGLVFLFQSLVLGLEGFNRTLQFCDLRLEVRRFIGGESGREDESDEGNAD